MTWQDSDRPTGLVAIKLPWDSKSNKRRERYLGCPSSLINPETEDKTPCILGLSRIERSTGLPLPSCQLNVRQSFII